MRQVDNQGFTLIEVLIALTVLGVTMVAVFAGFSSGLKLRSSTRDRVAFDRDARLMLNSLRDDFANLVSTGPGPMISADAIVLWRLNPIVFEGVQRSGPPLLVTYQWSGSSVQDSLLVRTATPLRVNPADFNLVQEEFMRWARLPNIAADANSHLVREDEGASRFGSTATLNNLSGSWVAYPSILSFACQITDDVTEDTLGETQSRVQVNISPVKLTTMPAGHYLPSELISPSEVNPGIEVGFWLPIRAQIPSYQENNEPGEVLP